ncbi:MAG: Hpt domain-containing protein [Candidatus Marithrix sp.]|nr:Hpt domain-containing protein [Candidatus Marithrix sp.]
MPDLLNFKVIKKLKEATIKRGPDFLNSLVDNFLIRSTEIIAEITQSFRQNDFTKMYKHVHQLKGTAASFGAEQLSLLCLELETADHNKLEILIEQLTICLDETKPEIKQAFITN